MDKYSFIWKEDNSQHPQDLQWSRDVKVVAHEDPKRPGLYMTSVYYINDSRGLKDKKTVGVRGKSNQEYIKGLIKEKMQKETQ